MKEMFSNFFVYSLCNNCPYALYKRSKAVKVKKKLHDEKTQGVCFYYTQGQLLKRAVSSSSSNVNSNEPPGGLLAPFKLTRYTWATLKSIWTVQCRWKNEGQPEGFARTNTKLQTCHVFNGFCRSAHLPILISLNQSVLAKAKTNNIF